MVDISPQAIAAARAELGIPDERFPRHVAIIMDGNGRWARRRGLPRQAGHSAGAKVVRNIVTEAARLGIEVLTLYSFSIENWRRPREEVNALTCEKDIRLASQRKERNLAPLYKVVSTEMILLKGVCIPLFQGDCNNHIHKWIEV